MAIQSFGNKETREFFETGKAKKQSGWRSVSKIVLRKLDMIHYAGLLSDLKVPPGNRLEALKGKWNRFYSIRVNDQWRIVFEWGKEGPSSVMVIDYH